jgi:lyso-ornithine lipid O-acyltransferase
MAAMARVFFILLIFAAVTLPLLPLQMIAHRFERLWHKSLPHQWQKFMCRLLGFKVTVNGNLSQGRPLLLVSNHVSWSDILVLGSLAEVSFIAKSEVKAWPLFGTFAKLQRTVFVDRDRKHKAIDQAREIAERLHRGDILILFAEGTTSDGNRVLPFKSSLFGAARAALDVKNGDAVDHVLIQPVSIAYTRVQGLPMGRYHRKVVAWPGTMPFVKHFLGLLRAGAIDIEVSFGEPVMFDRTSDRKELSRRFERQIRSMTNAALRFDPKLGASRDSGNTINGAP